MDQNPGEQEKIQIKPEYNWDRIWCPEVRFNKQEYMEDFVFERPDSFLEASLYKSKDLRKKLYETFVDFMAHNNGGVLDHEEVVHEEASMNYSVELFLTT